MREGSFNHSHVCVCALAVAALLAGCQSAPLRPMPPGGKIVSGQVQVATRKIALIGEFSARYTPEEFQCEISKGAGIPLITVHTLGPELARVEGGGKVWQGARRFAPGFLKSYIELGDAFQGDADPSNCLVLRKANRMEVEFLKRNDRFVFLLDR